MDVIQDSTTYKLEVSRFKHRGEYRILLSFPYEKPLISIIKTVYGRKYSKTFRSWYLPYELNSLVVLHERHIEISVKQENRNDPLFLKFQKKYQRISTSFPRDENLKRKIHFLIGSFPLPNRAEMKDYVTFLSSEGYSWNSINVFSKYAMKYINGGLNDINVGNELILSKDIYNKILETFLKFRKSV
ncbi:MAG: hypothetical protein ACJA01_000785 [Saprospiraceae bacterium]|jgi:hypothetical protein